ncbi:hypothetical protein CEXT_96001 [Caerostris extrusa]|uniref:Uncharacterized protein n=1 Tax=Caerostris extrusa TaxID=172846 RepID=A0AAV4W253_CAEEX|nr:hypothetical protein CEXT_96001 [Caerostris extrusa]
MIPTARHIFTSIAIITLKQNVFLSPSHCFSTQIQLFRTKRGRAKQTMQFRGERGGGGGGTRGVDVSSPSVSRFVPTRADYDAISQGRGGIDKHFVLVCGSALAPVDKQFASLPRKIFFDSQECRGFQNEEGIRGTCE